VAYFRGRPRFAFIGSIFCHVLQLLKVFSPRVGVIEV